MWIEMALEQERKKRIARTAHRYGLAALTICTIGAVVIAVLSIVTYVVKLFK